MTHLFTKAWNDFLERAKTGQGPVAIRLENKSQTFRQVLWNPERIEYAVVQGAIGTEDWQDLTHPIYKKHPVEKLGDRQELTLAQENAWYHKAVGKAALAYKLLEKNGVDAHVNDYPTQIHLKERGSNYEPLKKRIHNN